MREHDEKPNKDVAVEKQPTPRGQGLPIHDKVKDDIDKRKELGIRKYGQPLMPFNGRDAIIDAYQEALDLAVYLRQYIEEASVIVEVLFGVILTACTVAEEGGDVILDSHGISEYAEAMRLLEYFGKVNIVGSTSPKRLIAKVVN